MTNISNPGNTPDPAGQPNYMPDWAARWHTRTVAEIRNPEDPGQPVKVTLFRDDAPADSDPQRAVISAEHADSMHPTTAVELAAGLLAAVAIMRDDQLMADALVKVGHKVGQADAGDRLAEDVAGAVGEHGDAVPAAVLRLILDRYAERCGDLSRVGRTSLGR